MDSKLLVGLIKEVVKNEVKQQVKEELAKLIKSGVVTLNKEKKQMGLSEINKPANTIATKKQIQNQTTQKPIKEFTKNPILNEILNMTTPFTNEHRAEGAAMGLAGGSVLDIVNRNENDWGEINYNTNNISYKETATVSENEDVNVVLKALNRDYSELVKRF